LAQDILQHFAGLRGLLHAPASELNGIKGLGPAKQAELMAVIELARRALAQEMSQQAVLDSPATMMDFVRLQIGNKPHECFMVIFLDVKQRLIAFEEMFRGSLASTSVYPREVAQRALQLHSSAVVLAHNHPSGDVSPSPADIQLTSKLRAALALLDIRVLDHVITGPDRALSMAEQGLL
jgi:DNA repair protein RadC